MTIPVCTGYRLGGETLTEWPVDLGVLARCEPVYETLPGWGRPTRGVAKYEDLPHEARRYVERLEEITGVPVAVVSTGSGRADTIVREASLAASWVGQEAGGPGR